MSLRPVYRNPKSEVRSPASDSVLGLRYKRAKRQPKVVNLGSFYVPNRLSHFIIFDEAIRLGICIFYGRKNRLGYLELEQGLQPGEKLERCQIIC